MKVLLTGANGQLGRCIQDRTPTDIDLIALTRAELDITDQVNVMTLCEKLKPDFIINAAAYTLVDKAESAPETAFAINVTGAENLAYAAAKLDIPIIHVSTDYVFDGTAITPYTPNCPTNPQSVYGQTKLDGENSIKAITSKHIIIRTAWVFSEYGNNFVKTMLRLGAERDELGIVADQVGCPTYAGDLAKCIFDFLVLIKSNATKAFGIYHFCGDEQVSWYEFASAIFDEAKTKKVVVNKPILKKLTTSEYPTPAKRPKYSVMKDSSPHVDYSDWQTALKNII
ncbi:dTDP-4-dehydrorhamnose reductase [Pseudoalteromonas distincta]|uniref:dTDP-4-dehydrorhamnose reductase n=1 Tax=Pseudoalteromonas distincta TaxID=77608 RepID=UPI0011F2DC66|nr:dTDP-4-dehydrorhamnose reductase [Pseudoalteromonas distincta]KAA1162958.1 dTDP-4-dehydrorhamnose reductase [Pseudoalteromonas distincta]